MEQHPVPQQISAYHFRLVGDMTLKQFLELLAGILAAWVIYSLPLASIFRWPLVIFSVFLGVAFAFLPIEERSLDHWLIAFIKASYSPTKYYWQKKVVIPAFFAEIKIKKTPEKETFEVDRSKLEQYLESLPARTQDTALDNRESQFISDIMKIYFEIEPTTKKRVSLKRITAEIRERVPKVIVRKLKTPPLDPHAIMRGEVILPKRSGAGISKISIPEEKPIKIEKAAPTLQEKPPQNKQQEKPTLQTLVSENMPLTAAVPLKPAANQPTAPATLKPSLPIPTPPTQPNVLVGMVTDNHGNILENAIITIKDSKGNIARAQKTNKIGQFFIATPLVNGSYEIEVESEGVSFDIIKIELSGKPVLPIELKAK